MNKRIEDHDDPFGPFNLSDFKKWMQHQQDAKNKNLIGQKVESKIPIKKLASRIEIQEGEFLPVLKDFKKNGGIIIETSGQDFLVDTKKGNFLVSKTFIKIKDD